MGRLAEQVATSNDRITELVAIAQRKSRKSRASSVVPSTPKVPKDISEDAKAAFEKRPRPPELPPKKKPTPKKQKPTGRKPLPEHLEAETHELTPTVCASCGNVHLDMVDVIVETKLHVVKEHIRRRVVYRKTGRCRACGERTTPRSLPAPFPRSKATCGWLAWLVYMHCVLLVPLDRLRRDMAQRGIPLAMSYLVSQLERAADLLNPIDGEHWKQLLQGSWMAMDATGLKVLIPKLPGSHNGYLEAFRNDDAIVFQYEAHKGGEVLVQKLSSFEGTLVADAEHRHNGLFVSGKIIEAGCNAHGRRKFEAAEKSQPTLAKEGGQFISAIYLEEEKAQKQGLVGKELYHWRQKKIIPIIERFDSWIQSTEPILTPDDELAKVLRYYQNHWDALFRFLENPEIPIDNSATEREYQNVAKLRYNRLFAGSTEGAHRMATLLGIVASCRPHGVEPRAYLTWAFTRLGTHRDVFGLTPAEMTPAAFKRSQTR